MMRQLLPRRVKRWSKPLVTVLMFAAGYYRWWRLRLPPDRAVILLYHHVAGGADGAQGAWSPFQRGISRSNFAHQMQFLRKAMTPISLPDLVTAIRNGKSLPPRAVVVTFDDGYLDNFAVAYPILKEYGIPATIFVSTGFIDTAQSFWWDQVYAMLQSLDASAVFDGGRITGILGIRDKVLPFYPLTTPASRMQAAEAVINAVRTLPSTTREASLARLRAELGRESETGMESPSLVTWAQLREMSQNGVAVESHTHTHPILGVTDADAVEKEFVTSKRLIEKHLGQAVDGVAYPDGREGTYNTCTMKIAQAVGFRFGCIAQSKTVEPGSDLFALGRLPVGNISLPVFVRDLLRAYGTV
jgi:peptidoglycan/xylan/chitin deacetylase (PgdA/CDA1 family)